MHYVKKLSALFLMIASLCVAATLKAADADNPMAAYTEMMSRMMGGMQSGQAGRAPSVPANPMGMTNPMMNPMTMGNPMMNPMTMGNPMMNPMGAMLNPMMLYPMMMAPMMMAPMMNPMMMGSMMAPMMMPMTGMMNPMMPMTSPLGMGNPPMTHPGAMVPFFTQPAPQSNVNFMDQWMKQMQQMAPKPENK